MKIEKKESEMSDRPTPETDAPILSKSGSDSFSARLHDFFKGMRFDKNHHLGLGDIRLTLGQQEELAVALCERDEAIAAKKSSAADWLGQIEQANTRVSRALQQVAMAERERDEARELAEAYKEYAQLLGDEINDMVTLAHVHGWQSSRIEQGKVLREKIKQLEEKK